MASLVRSTFRRSSITATSSCRSASSPKEWAAYCAVGIPDKRLVVALRYVEATPPPTEGAAAAGSGRDGRTAPAAEGDP